MRESANWNSRPISLCPPHAPRRVRSRSDETSIITDTSLDWNEQRMVISIEGCIGSGKSTTARLVAERLRYSVLLEETANHPFLADFYSQPAFFALETELAFVLLHYHQFKEVGPGSGLVADFSLGKDLVF